jgi:hypothetical protein
MVIVDEVDEAIVDPLVVGNVRVGPMDAHGLARNISGSGRPSRTRS